MASTTATVRAISAAAPGPEHGTPAALPLIVDQALESGGEALAPQVRAFFERCFGHNLGSVREHTGPRAAHSARAVNAAAYTAGTHIVFGSGRYAPHSSGGRRLLAHELAHVVQQSDGRRPRDAIDPGSVDPLERAADRMADTVLDPQTHGGPDRRSRWEPDRLKPPVRACSPRNSTRWSVNRATRYGRYGWRCGCQAATPTVGRLELIRK